jgi:kynurenine formamidase
MIVAQRIDTALHVGTHIDGAMHGTDGVGDMASFPLDFQVGSGAVVNVSRHIEDWAVITPDMIERAPVEIRSGDILIVHTGCQRYWEGQKQQDLVRYFCMHPGGTISLLEWMLKKKIKWFGIDCGSGDHSMNTSIRHMRPDIARRFDEKVGKSGEEFFGDFPELQMREPTQRGASFCQWSQFRILAWFQPY